MNRFAYTSAEQFCDVQDTAGREFRDQCSQKLLMTVMWTAGWRSSHQWFQTFANWPRSSGTSAEVAGAIFSLL